MIHLSLAQRLQLLVIFAVMKTLWLLDDIGYVFRKSVVYSARLSTLMFVVFVATTAVVVDVIDSAFYKLPDVFSPQSTEVLGVAQEKGPIINTVALLPEFTAASVFAKDISYSEALLDLNSTAQLAPASTTKLMTALVALDLYELDEVLTIPDYCTEIDGQKAGFFAGDSYSVEDLLYGLLVNSSADAACALAVGQVSYADFIDLMNAKASALGMKNSQFTNPIGLDGLNGSHFSTAQDLYTLAVATVSHELIRDIVATHQITLRSTQGNSVTLTNTNELLWGLPGTVGVKTGRTEEAGEVLIYEYADGLKDIVIVVMKSEDRFGDAAAVLNWILGSYRWLE